VHARFTSNLAVAILGAILVTMALSFRPAVVGWLGLGVGCAALACVVIAFAFRGRGPAQRTLDIAVALIATWTIIASRAFSGSTLRWLTFSEAAALATLGVIGLIVHEALLGRALQSHATRREDDRPAAIPAREHSRLAVR
jgi:hypothetical protein